jgi:DNA polymerase-3 subunit delta
VALPEQPEERTRAAVTLTLQMAREMKAEIDRDAAAELADLCNTNLAAIRSELDKLATYTGPGGTIRRADVTALAISEKKYTVWELADMLASGDRKRAFVFLNNLLQAGEPAPAMIGSMAWMYRSLLQLQEMGPRMSSTAG